MPFDFDKPQPLADAVKDISKKTPVGAALSSDQWEKDVPERLKADAIFAAKVESVRAIQNLKDGLLKILTMARDESARNGAAMNAGKPGAYQMDRAKFIEENQRLANRLGLRTKDQAKRGTVEDFGSERRLKLIYEQQIGAAQSRAYYLQGQDPDLLDAWPAQEFVRVSNRRIKRDWKRRWNDAAVAIGWQGVSAAAAKQGRLIALKTSPIWAKLSRFNRPYPPFDYNSGMGVVEIDRDAAEALGDIIKPGEKIEPSVARDEPREVSIAGLDPDTRQLLQTAFDGQLDLSGDVARWSGGNTPAPLPPASPAPAPAPTPAPKPAPKPPEPAPVPTPPDPAPAPAAPVPPIAAPVPVPAKLKPQGPAVSAAADLQVSKADQKKMRAVLAAIDRVHGDGTLQAIPFNRRVHGKADGTYWSSGAAAASIGVKKSGATPAVSMAHEIGHWLDHIGIPSITKMASEGSDPMFARWRQVVEASATIQKIATTKFGKYRDYLLKPREIWARAYSQFIAIESGDATLLEEMNKVRDGKTGFAPENHWPDAEFEPIAAEMRAIFQQLGWMKK